MVLLRLSKNDLLKIKGGVSFWAVVGAVAAALFGVGAIDGYTRPVKCR